MSATLHDGDDHGDEHDLYDVLTRVCSDHEKYFDCGGDDHDHDDDNDHDDDHDDYNDDDDDDDDDDDNDSDVNDKVIDQKEIP